MNINLFLLYFMKPVNGKKTALADCLFAVDVGCEREGYGYILCPRGRNTKLIFRAIC